MLAFRRMATALTVAVVFITQIQFIYADNSIVDTQYGTIQGIVTPQFRAFLGVPFAAPPGAFSRVDNFRWKSPQPATTWSGIRDATSFAPDCAQPVHAFTSYQSEDCLYLNVWTPAVITKALPVMVWFYGGCWTGGATSFPLYNGQYLASTYDVIVVTVNYRLAAFGFIGSKALAAEDPNNATGNYGLLDQRAALQWVQTNIGNFGGNKLQVTIFGQSAGSGSIANHLIMPRSWGLFSKAILESGPIASWSAKNWTTASFEWDMIARGLGCYNRNHKIELQCLRKLPTSSFMTFKTNYTCTFLCCFQPIIDGSDIIAPPVELAQQGRFVQNVPIMVGTTLDEATTFMNLPVWLTDAGYKQALIAKYGPTLGQAVYATYPSSSYPSPWWAFAAAWRDEMMTCPARHTARMVSPSSPVYHYQFTHVVTETKVDPWLGSFHGVEIPFAFKINPVFDIMNLPIVLDFPEQRLQSQVSQLWVNFATNGNPNIGGNTNVTWPAYQTSTDQSLSINLHSKPISGLESAKCDFWDKAFPPTAPTAQAAKL